MEIKSKILLSIFAVLIFLSIGISFYRFFILRDYPVQVQIGCDPYVEVCTVYHCDSEVETCSGDSEKDTSYYKILTRNAGNIPLCDPSEDSCAVSLCPQGEEGCIITACEDGNECSDPVLYSREHPVTNDAIDNSNDMAPGTELNESAQ